MKIPGGDIPISELTHAFGYDPAKRRAYYLRTRKLKGRKKGAIQPQTQKLKPLSAKQKRSTEKKLADIKEKLDRLARLGQSGKSDVAMRTASERASLAKRLSGLNEKLKTKLAEGAPQSEIDSLREEINKLKTATKNG